MALVDLATVPQTDDNQDPPSDAEVDAVAVVVVVVCADVVDVCVVVDVVAVGVVDVVEDESSLKNSNI